MRLRFPALLSFFVSANAAEVERLLPFQARLTDAAGNSLPDKSMVIRFRIFDSLTSEQPIWAGELHRVTVNQGLVNVVLGSKNRLPTHYPGDDTRSFFGSTLYLEATPDANGDDRITDDPPLLPRQAILPVLFAAEAERAHQADRASEAERARNADQLTGHDWSVIFGAADPATGFVATNRIQPASIGNRELSAELTQLLAEHSQGLATSSARINTLLNSQQIGTDSGWLQLGDTLVCWGRNNLALPPDPNSRHTRSFNFQFARPFRAPPVVVHGLDTVSSGFAFAVYSHNVDATSYSGSAVEIQFRATSAPVTFNYLAIGRAK